MPRPSGLHRYKVLNWADQITTANALVEASIVVSEMLEEGGHRTVLVALAVKVMREASSGEASIEEGRRDLGVVAHRATNTSDPGTCGGLVSDFMCLLLCKREINHHTYRMQGT
jgi:hypothetical protein